MLALDNNIPLTRPICSFLLLLLEFMDRSHYINTVLPTVTMEENERRRDGVPEKKAEVPRSGKRATGYFWTDEITGIHCMLEWMKSGTNFL